MKRLETLIGLLKSRTVIDIGSDHAYLPKLALANNIVDLAYVCDINVEPLLSGYRTVKQAQLLDKTKFVLTNGLDYQVTNEGVDIVIAGMGGKEIISIIDNLSQPFTQLILQPNNHVISLRQYLQTKNLEISYESVVSERDKDYAYLVITPNPNTYTDKEIYVGRGNDDNIKMMRNKRLLQLQEINKKHPLSEELLVEYQYLSQEE